MKFRMGFSQKQCSSQPTSKEKTMPTGTPHAWPDKPRA